MQTINTTGSGPAALPMLATTALAIATVFALAAPAIAVDISGMTILAEGISDRRAYNGADETFTYPMEIYFGTKGNRFVLSKGTTGSNRILVPAGSDKGSRRRKDGHFLQIVELTQGASSLRIKFDSRAVEEGYANETFVYQISFTATSCRVDEFKYLPDGGQYLSKSVSKEGNCTLTRGAPSGLSDN